MQKPIDYLIQILSKQKKKIIDSTTLKSFIYEAYYGSGQIEIIELTDKNKDDFCIDEMEKII